MGQQVATLPKKFYTIQRVNGNGGNGKGDGIAGPHKHSLEESDKVKKNSVIRWILKTERDKKKVQVSPRNIFSYNFYKVFDPHIPIFSFSFDEIKTRCRNTHFRCLPMARELTRKFPPRVEPISRRDHVIYSGELSACSHDFAGLHYDLRFVREPQRPRTIRIPNIPSPSGRYNNPTIFFKHSGYRLLICHLFFFLTPSPNFFNISPLQDD